VPVYGSLVISDGLETVVLPNCKLDDLRIESEGDSGTIWLLTIVDRRWRWRDLGGISGYYNQLDPHGKFIPWTIRSPTQLAVACLQAMGETTYTLNLPPGLDSSVGQGQGAFLTTGLTFPPTGTNPPINWVAVPPAQALQQVADLFGCRVIYRHSDDGVLVTPAGIGALLPPGSIHTQGPSIKSPETPDSIGVVGAPTRYQGQFALVPVGEEWDGSYRPIDLLSYAPQSGGAATPGQVQISTATIQYDQVTTGLDYQVTVNGVLFPWVAIAGTDTAVTIAGGIAGLIVASFNAAVQGVVTVTTSGDSGTSIITVTGLAIGVPFDFACGITGGGGGPNVCAGALVQQAKAARAAGVGSWTYCPPPIFPSVVATDRLTKEQAQALAQKSVWKCYQLSGVDVSEAGNIFGPSNVPIFLPGYGSLLRKQQLIISDAQCDQIVPNPGDDGINVYTFSTTGPGFISATTNLYNGYSRDKAAAVYGRVATEIFNKNFIYAGAQATLRTDPDSQVMIPFTTDPVWQVVTFSSHVYDFLNGQFRQPFLRLQCACNVRNPLTNAVERFTQIVPLPGQLTFTNPKIERHEDVQLNVTSIYNGTTLTFVSILEADPFARAAYYLAGLAAQYELPDAQVIEYNGIHNIQLDGAIAQITWSIGSGGASSTVSRNTEHHLFVPSYPDRRRAEGIPALLAGHNVGTRTPLFLGPLGL
jgi:hypothetical protein